MNKEYIMQNLNGLGPIDWEQAKKDFAIKGFEPEKLNIVPRDEVMQSLVTVELPPAVLEVQLADWQCEKDVSKSEEARQLRALARNYIVLSNKEARLPKFSKWVSSMFQSNEKLMIALSRAGQTAPQNDETGIIISCNPIDILRGAEGPHFWSCLGHDGGYKSVLKGVVTKCPGIAVAYINAPDGKMKGRIWLNHSQVNGRDTISVMRVYGNGFTVAQVGKLIASKGYDVYKHHAYDGGVKIKLVNTFNEAIHWDILEYGEPRGELIAKAEEVVKKVAA